MNKRSIFDYFATPAAGGKNKSGKETAGNWSLKRGLQLYNDRKFIRHALPVGSQKDKSPKNSLSALPNKPTIIVDGTVPKENTKSHKIVFLNLVSVSWFVDRLKILDEANDGRLSKHFHDFNDFEKKLTKDYSVELDGAKYVPIRVAGIAAWVQSAVKSFGLDFGRVVAVATGVAPTRGVYNETNADLINEWAYHGVIELSQGTDKVTYDANILLDSERFSEYEALEKTYRAEIAGKLSVKKGAVLLDDSGRPITLLTYCHFASEMRAKNTKEIGNLLKVVDKKANSNMTQAATLAFATSLKALIQKALTEKTAIQIVKSTQTKGKKATSDLFMLTTLKEAAKSAKRFVHFPKFTIDDDEIPKGTILIAAWPANRVSKKDSAAAEKDETTTSKPTYDPVPILDAFLEKLESAGVTNTKKIRNIVLERIDEAQQEKAKQDTKRSTKVHVDIFDATEEPDEGSVPRVSAESDKLLEEPVEEESVEEESVEEESVEEELEEEESVEEESVEEEL
jgi:hypothetical protein